MRALGGDYLCEDELKEMGFAEVGVGARVHSRASLYNLENIYLGENARIDDFCVIIATSKVFIGNFVHIANYCYLGGTAGIEIQDFSGLAPRVSIFSASDDYTGMWLTNPTVPRSLTGGVRGLVRLEKHVIIGAHSVILPNVSLAEGTAIGACSLVKSGTTPWGIYGGSPARRLRDRGKNPLELETRVPRSGRR
jgi:acetyltransferase-like isoleucine patch superfamily enzyme